METSEQFDEIERKKNTLLKEREMLLAEEESKTLKDELMSKVNEFEEAKKKLMQEVQAKFAIVVGAIMRKSEHILTYTIQAYTPYFNDGDTCTYSVNTWGDVNRDVEDRYESNRGDDWNAKDAETEEELKKFLEQIDDSIYKEVFGDHVEIMFKRDGTAVVSQYDHD
jgi:hypothetical protein